MLRRKKTWIKHVMPKSDGDSFYRKIIFDSHSNTITWKFRHFLRGYYSPAAFAKQATDQVKLGYCWCVYSVHYLVALKCDSAETIVILAFSFTRGQQCGHFLIKLLCGHDLKITSQSKLKWSEMIQSNNLENFMTRKFYKVINIT